MPYLPGQEAREISQKLEADPKALTQLIPHVLHGKPDSSELLLFIDQLEELVTLVSASYRAPFAEMLSQSVAGGRVRAVATLRSDFYHQMIPISGALIQLLQNGSYPLGAPDPESLYEMIVRPAERAGLQFEDGIARRILNETGSEPGRLPLMAYLLDELYQRRTADGRLTSQAYADLGGVAGAIGQRAEQVFETLSPDAQAALPHVFRRLVEVDERGTPTRRRALQEEIDSSAPTESTEPLLTAFIKARLLVSDEQGGKRTTEVAHEALLRKWDRLARWIEQTQDDLRLLRQVKLAAADWHHHNRHDAFRWADERLKPVYATIQRMDLDEGREFSSTERVFIRRESERLLEEIEDSNTPHIRRRSIGERLCVIGDARRGVGLRPDGLPDIDWCKVEIKGMSSVEVEIADGIGIVKVDIPFCISRYPVTYSQFQSFIDAADGYHSEVRDWFAESAADEYERQLGEQRVRLSNYPRETVNWYEAMAFCRWLSCRFATKEPPTSRSERNASNLKYPAQRESRSRSGESFEFGDPFIRAVRLPTEAEWQFAAAGIFSNKYPWGNEWDGRLANTDESGLAGTIAVGMYPGGASACGALDMSGNVWEWTLTEPGSGRSDNVTNLPFRVGRGGSWHDVHRHARADSRFGNYSSAQRNHSGFRLVGVVPSPYP